MRLFFFLSFYTRLVGSSVKKLPKMELVGLHKGEVWGKLSRRRKKVENKVKLDDLAIHLSVKFYCCLEEPPEGDVHVKPVDSICGYS